jgi:hypothetical protein
MLSALSAPTMLMAEAPRVEAALGGYDDIPDNGSSSLSELGDASDDHSEPTPRPTTAGDLDDDDDDDSEAETERLENTPRKFGRTATDTSLLSEALYTRTPSKLGQSRAIDEDDSAPPSPSVITELDEPIEADNPLHSLSLAAASEAASFDFAGKKRKRTSVEGSPVEDHGEDEPARKRSGTAKSPVLNGSVTSLVDSAEQIDVDEELEIAEERLSQLVHEELDLEERQANIAAETIGELATVAKLAKPRKGGRRGKRKTEDSNYGLGEHFTVVEPQDVEGEDDNDEEHSVVLDEEVAKKKNAIDELAKIEKKFKLFREK